MAEISELEGKIRRIRARLFLKHPFFGYLLSRCKIVWSEKVQTAGITPFGTIYLSRNWVSKLSEDEVEGVLVHEILHLALKHHWRRGNRKMLRWNVACDYAINWILEKLSFSLPCGALLDPIFGGMTAEEIYEKVSEVAGYVCDLLEEDGEGEFNIDEIIKEAKKAGKIPSEVEELLDDLLPPRLNWRELLWKYVVSYLPSDYSWRKPSKRLRSQGLYLPSIVRDEGLDLCVAVDVSGSVSSEELKEFFWEIAGICGSFPQLRGKIVTCDCEIHDVFELNASFSPQKLRIRGRGGTSTLPVFEYVRKNLPNCGLLIYLTDGETGKEGVPSEPPPYPVIWVLSKRGTDKYLKFGKIVKMDG